MKVCVSDLLFTQEVQLEESSLGCDWSRVGKEEPCLHDGNFFPTPVPTSTVVPYPGHFPDCLPLSELRRPPIKHFWTRRPLQIQSPSSP